MILKPKPLDQKTDGELIKDLKKANDTQSWLERNSTHVNHGIAVALFAAGWYTMKGLWGLGMATGNLPLLLGGMVSGPAIWAVGLVGCAVGWANIYNKVFSAAEKKKADVRKEMDDREYRKTPAYARAMQWAKEEAARAKEALKKAFNDAVGKAFHDGTENKVAVKKPLQLKKPGEPPPKKKKFFGLSR